MSSTTAARSSRRQQQDSDTTLNAKTVPTTLAKGTETYGELNQHPITVNTTTDEDLTFRVGVSVDRNKKCRRTMEDAHSFIYDFGGIKGQGFFAIFDGHAGKHAAEWCGMEFHKVKHTHFSLSFFSFSLSIVLTNLSLSLSYLFHVVSRVAFIKKIKSRTTNSLIRPFNLERNFSKS